MDDDRLRLKPVVTNQHLHEMVDGSAKITNHVYLNVGISPTGADPIVASYVTNQTLPILSQQEDFMAEVSRFKVPLAGMPFFFWEEQQYYIGLGITTVDATQYEQVRNTDILPPSEVPFFPTYDQNINFTGSFPQLEKGVFHINDLVRGVNASLRLLWEQAKGTPAFSGLLDYLNKDEYPELVWSSTDNLFKFHLPLAEYPLADPDGDATAGYVPPFYPAWIDQDPLDISPLGQSGLRIFLSSKLYNLLNGFPAYNYGSKGVQDTDTEVFFPQLNYGLKVNFDRGQVCTQSNHIYARPQNDRTIPPNDDELPYPYFCWNQEQTSIFAWQKSSRILVTTSMGFVKETSVTSRDTNGTPITFELLTDFDIQQDSSVSNREYVYYANQGGDRYIDTKGTGQLNRVDLQIFIEYDNGLAVPLVILPGYEVNMKIQFKRKPHNSLKQVSDTSRYTMY
jgi:hypothetical protein